MAERKLCAINNTLHKGKHKGRLAGAGGGARGAGGWVVRRHNALNLTLLYSLRDMRETGLGCGNGCGK